MTFPGTLYRRGPPRTPEGTVRRSVATSESRLARDGRCARGRRAEQTPVRGPRAVTRVACEMLAWVRVWENNASQRFTARVREELQERGFARITLENTAALEAAASALGQPVALRDGDRIVTALSPTRREQARRRSLSAIHGMGEFPLHTDGAHLPTTPRYIVLRCVSPGAAARETLLADTAALQLSAADWALLRRAVYVIDDGRSPRRLRSIAVRTGPSRHDIRFDDGCMRPAHPSFAEAGRRFRDALDRNDPIRLVWKEGDAVIIDNRRCLHGRGPSDTPDNDRILERVTVL